MSSSPEDVDRRVTELQSKVDSLAGALAAAQTTRRLLTLAFLVFTLVSSWVLFSLVSYVRSDAYKEKLLAELQKSVEANQEEFSREAQKIIDQAGPVITTALSEQSKKDAPLFMQAFESERDTLMAELPVRLTELVQQRHRDLLHKHDRLIEDQFPELQDPAMKERVVGNVVRALDKLVQKYYVDEYKKSLGSMAQSWEEFPPAPPPAKDDAPLDEQLMGQLLDLVAAKLASHRSGHAPLE